VRDFTPLALGSAGPRLRHRGVYLITGGTGGVGICIARFLAREAAARLVLLSRSVDALEPSVRHEIEALGGEVVVMRGDVALAADVRAAVDAARTRYGSLDGVVHAAGVTTGKSIFEPIETLAAAAFDEQLRPKLGGAEALAVALGGSALDFVLLISSNAAVLGGLGLAAYAAANAALDAFAVAQSRAGAVPWISASWDGWPTARRAAFDAQQLTAMDRLAMSAAESETALRLVLAAPPGHVVVSAADLHGRLRRWTSVAEPEAADRATPRPSDPAVDPITATIAGLWCDMLGLAQVHAHANFFELRGDSLLGSRMITRLNALLGVHLPLRALFEAPTVAGLRECVRAIRAATAGEIELVI
jgi:phthiocerol/phenolphthiocerol synthesis type-I polyketide synthase E